MPKIKIAVTLASGATFETVAKDGSDADLAQAKELFKAFVGLNYLSLELRDGVEVFLNPRHVAAIVVDEGNAS